MGMLQWVVFYLALGLAGTWLALRYALWRNLFDHPGERRSHQVATPRGGGAAIVAALLIAAAWLASRDPQQHLLLGTFAAGLVLVAGVGLVDDHRALSPWLRLSAHALAAVLFALALLQVGGDWRCAVAAFLAVMVLTNIWNFMDGINGLAASQAIIVTAVIAWLAGGTWGWLAATLAAATVGFLPYNFPKARIFLGDVGSGAIGFSIAVLGVMLIGQHEKTSWLLVFPLSAFLVDSGLTLLRRILRGEPWWNPHSQHAYQVWSRRAGHAPVTAAYAGWTLAGAGVMLAGAKASDAFMLCSALAWYTTAGFMWVLLQRMEPVEIVQLRGKDT